MAETFAIRSSAILVPVRRRLWLSAAGDERWQAIDLIILRMLDRRLLRTMFTLFAIVFSRLAILTRLAIFAWLTLFARLALFARLLLIRLSFTRLILWLRRLNKSRLGAEA